MVTHSTGGELYAVANEVVLVCQNVERVNLAALGLKQRFHTAGGHGERVVAELQLAGFLADLVHGEIDDPAELVALFIHVALARRAEHTTHDACGLLGLLTLACGEEHERIRLERQRGFDGFHGLFIRIDKLCDAAGNGAGFIDLEPVRLLAGLHLYVCAELIDRLAGKLAVGDRDSFDDVVLKRAEAAVLQNVRNVLDAQVDAQVRLIGAELLHGLTVRDAGKRCGGRDVIRAVLCKNRRKNVFDDGKNVFLRGKRHFHIHLVEFARRTVAARILVAEARCDLEVAVKARGHEELLKLLRQGVELARVLTRRDEVITRALRRRSRENRRGDL